MTFARAILANQVDMIDRCYCRDRRGTPRLAGRQQGPLVLYRFPGVKLADEIREEGGL